MKLLIISKDDIDPWLKTLKESHINFVRYTDDSEITKKVEQNQPDGIITIGQSWKLFPNVGILSHNYRRKWTHFNDYILITVEKIMYNCINGAVELTMNKSLTMSQTPLISVFSNSYNSGEKIDRAYNSLLKQTYKNWEWVILDDSTDSGETFEKITAFKESDYRIRVFKSDRNLAKIGTVKRNAAMMCFGSILVELDHDDELTPDCLMEVKKAFVENPDVDFVYMDWGEIMVDTMEPCRYNNKKFGYTFGFGYGGYYAQKYNGNIVFVASGMNINCKTIRNIVGIPNHPRVWKADFYRKIGGHSELPVADDYELIIRTFLNGKMLHIPKLGYIQYTNKGKDNTTNHRRKEIILTQKHVKMYYENKIVERLKELGLDDNVNAPFMPVWIQPYDYIESHCTKYMKPDMEKISIVMSTYNRPDMLRRAIKSVFDQTYKNWELIVIGDNCPVLNKVISEYYDDVRVRWWNLAKGSNDSGATPKNYALRMNVRTGLVAYLDDDNYWEPNHLESLFNLMNGASNDAPDFVFSSLLMKNEKDEKLATVICKEPKLYRIDTSAILHKFELVQKYGYWKTDMYAHDHDIVNRWVQNQHRWKASLDPTVNYLVDPKKCNLKKLYEHYQDQDPPEILSPTKNDDKKMIKEDDNVMKGTEVNKRVSFQEPDKIQRSKPLKMKQPFKKAVVDELD